MNNAEAVNWLINITTDIGKIEHQDLWHYEQALSEIKEMLEDAPTIEPEPKWIPCSERLPDEDHWLGGSGRQFSEKVIVAIVNHSDEDTWVDMTYTIDGEWACELPKYCEIAAWMPLPEPYREGEGC